jgi:hypothetical protein
MPRQFTWPAGFSRMPEATALIATGDRNVNAAAGTGTLMCDKHWPSQLITVPKICVLRELCVRHFTGLELNAKSLQRWSHLIKCGLLGVLRVSVIAKTYYGCFLPVCLSVASLFEIMLPSISGISDWTSFRITQMQLNRFLWNLVLR